MPGEEELAPDAGPGPSPSPSARCTATSLELCIDFEGSNNDAFNATITAVNVVPETRQQEGAARVSTSSQFKVASARLDIPMHLTIEMWTKPFAVPTNTDQQFGVLDVHSQYRMNFDDDLDIECDLGGSDIIDSQSLVLGVWHHVACTYDGNTLKVYVNGRVEGCRSVTRQISTSGTLGAAIGANLDVAGQVKNPFIGELDNVHVYSRSLTAAEICAAWGNGNCSDACPSSGGQGGWGGD